MGFLQGCPSLRQGDQGASWGPFNFFPLSRKMNPPQFSYKLILQRSFYRWSIPLLHPVWGARAAGPQPGGTALGDSEAVLHLLLMAFGILHCYLLLW